MNSVRKLRRVFQPYAFLTVVMSAVTIMLAYMALHLHDWKPIVMMPVGWGLWGVLLMIGLRYRVYWDDAEIRQTASGGSDVVIRFDEITDIR